MPYEISTTEYQEFEENVIKEQKVICTQDEQYPRDKCVSIKKPLFQNGPKIQVFLASFENIRPIKKHVWKNNKKSRQLSDQLKNVQIPKTGQFDKKPI